MALDLPEETTLRTEISLGIEQQHQEDEDRNTGVLSCQDKLLERVRRKHHLHLLGQAEAHGDRRVLTPSPVSATTSILPLYLPEEDGVAVRLPEEYRAGTRRALGCRPRQRFWSTW